MEDKNNEVVNENNTSVNNLSNSNEYNMVANEDNTISSITENEQTSDESNKSPKDKKRERNVYIYFGVIFVALIIIIIVSSNAGGNNKNQGKVVLVREVENRSTNKGNNNKNKEKKSTLQYVMKLYLCNDGFDTVLDYECDSTPENKYSVETKTESVKIIKKDDKYVLYQDGDDVMLFYASKDKFKTIKLNISSKSIKTIKEYDDFKIFTNENLNGLKLYGIFLGNDKKSDLPTYNKTIYYDATNSEFKYRNEFDSIEKLNDNTLVGYKYNIDDKNNKKMGLINIRSNNIFALDTVLGDSSIKYQESSKLYLVSNSENSVYMVYNDKGNKLLENVNYFKEINGYYYYFADDTIYRANKKFDILKSIKVNKPVYIMNDVEYAIVTNQNNEYFLFNINSETSHKIPINFDSSIKLAHNSTDYFSKEKMSEKCGTMCSYYQLEEKSRYKFNPGIYIAFYKIDYDELDGVKAYAYFYDLTKKTITEIKGVANVNDIDGYIEK